MIKTTTGLQALFACFSSSQCEITSKVFISESQYNTELRFRHRPEPITTGFKPSGQFRACSLMLDVARLAADSMPLQVLFQDKQVQTRSKWNFCQKKNSLTFTKPDKDQIVMTDITSKASNIFSRKFEFC